MNNRKLNIVIAMLATGFVCTLCFILLTGAKPDPTPPAPSSSGYLVGSGSGYKLYRHIDKGNYVYVVINSSMGSVSVAK